MTPRARASGFGQRRAAFYLKDTRTDGREEEEEEEEECMVKSILYLLLYVFGTYSARLQEI